MPQRLPQHRPARVPRSAAGLAPALATSRVRASAGAGAGAGAGALAPGAHANGRWRAGAGGQAQRGATALLTVTVLVALAAASAAMGTRSLWLERLGSDNRGQALQARLAAESALARAAAQLQQAAQQGDLDAFWQDAQAADCPASHPPPGWECRRLDWPATRTPSAPGGNLPEAWQLQALALRHLTRSPHVVELQALAWQGTVRAQLGQSLYQPALAPVPAALPGPAPAHAPGVSGGGPAGCEAPAWQAVLGAQTESALRQLSQRQARAGLDDSSTPARTVYWVDSPQPWTQRLGSAGRPVLLVFSRQACAVTCPRLAAGSEVHGTVVFDAGCSASALPGRAAGQIDGRVVGLLLGPEGTAAASDRIVPSPDARDAIALRWPQGMDARHVQWVAGSWSLQSAP